MNVVKYAEHIFKLYVANLALDQICNITNLKKKMILEVCQHFAQDATEALPSQHEPTEEPLIEDDHRLRLLKCVANSYLTLRLSTYGKHYTETVVNFGQPSLRHQFTKLILFTQ